jgi:hypothetical protein
MPDIDLYVESLETQLELCSRPGRKKGEGARDVLQVLRDIGGTILETSHLPVGEGFMHDNPEGDIDETGSIIVQPGLAHPLLQPDAHTPKSARVASCSFGYIHSPRSFRMGQPVKPTKPEQVEAVASGQVALALLLYNELRPVYGWIDEPGENEPSTKSIQSADLKYLFWANFYGPSYVERYGRDFVLGAPGWKKEELDDGGVLYVVDESYIRWRTHQAAEAMDYFKPKAPSIRQYRSRGFERTEAMLAGDIKPKRNRRKPSS